MTYIFSKVPGQTPLGLFTNLWPTKVCRIDRKALGGWYLAVHIGKYRWTVLG